MDSRTYAEKLRDPRWQKRRLEIFQRDDWTCQLCSRTDLELHLHHLHRTTEDPWDEPDLHLLTVCRLCHDQQPGNPKGAFKHPKRLYVTDWEWWERHRYSYDAATQERLSKENVSGHTPRDLMRKIAAIDEAIHALRLEWEERQKK